MGSCSFYDSRYYRICDSSYCIFQKEQGEAGREKQPETIPTYYEGGLCDDGNMPCGYGYVPDDVRNTMNKRLMVFVGCQAFFAL